MRIISGEWRGKRLHLPPAEYTRPTTDRAKQALFNVLTNHLKTFEDLTVLDAFAGSGSLGLECLSRGATRVLFCENNVKTRLILFKNIADVRAQDRSSVYIDVCELPSADDPVHLVFLDPPYGVYALPTVIHGLYRKGYIDTKTYVALEVQKNTLPLTLKEHAECLFHKSYGLSDISLWVNIIDHNYPSLLM
jgi:16S rRNA (guanine966-N2)-methyltransferase